MGTTFHPPGWQTKYLIKGKAQNHLQHKRCQRKKIYIQIKKNSLNARSGTHPNGKHELEFLESKWSASTLMTTPTTRQNQDRTPTQLAFLYKT